MGGDGIYLGRILDIPVFLKVSIVQKHICNYTVIDLKKINIPQESTSVCCIVQNCMHVLYCFIQYMKMKTPRSQFCTCISVSNKTFMFVTLDNFS